MQMLAKTMAAAFKKKNERCFTCGDKTHFKNTHKKIKLLKKKKNLQEFALVAIREHIGPENASLNMMLKKSLFQETPNGGLPRSPSTKTRDKLHHFPQILNIRQCYCQYTRPK